MSILWLVSHIINKLSLTFTHVGLKSWSLWGKFLHLTHLTLSILCPSIMTSNPCRLYSELLFYLAVCWWKYTLTKVVSQMANGPSLEVYGWTVALWGKNVCVFWFLTQPQVSGSEFLTHTHTQRGDEIINSDYDWQTVHHTDTHTHTRGIAFS